MNKSANRKIVLIFIICLLLGDMYQLISLAVDPSCEQWGERAVNDKKLINNIWNQDFDIGAQCILTDVHKKYHLDGLWLWAWPGRAGPTIKSSPSLVYGFFPWGQQSTADKLPARLSRLKNISINYSFSTRGSGTHEAVLRIYLTTSQKPSPESISDEIVMGLNGHPLKPGTSDKDSLVLDGKKYSLESRQQTWQYISLESPTSSTSSTLDLLPLLNSLIKRGYIRSDLYLASIGLGDDVISGTGYTLVKSFSLDIR